MQDRRTPILGDDTYGVVDWNMRAKQQFGTRRPLLHALSTSFINPFVNTGKDDVNIVKDYYDIDDENDEIVDDVGRLRFIAPIPMDIRKVMQSLSDDVLVAEDGMPLFDIVV